MLTRRAKAYSSSGSLY